MHQQRRCYVIETVWTNERSKSWVNQTERRTHTQDLLLNCSVNFSLLLIWERDIYENDQDNQGIACTSKEPLLEITNSQIIPVISLEVFKG